MNTILIVGAGAIIGAIGTFVLKKKHRSDLAWTLELMMKLGLISSVGYILIQTGKSIIHMFGGFPY